VTLQFVASLTDDSRGIIYYRKMFLVLPNKRKNPNVRGLVTVFVCKLGLQDCGVLNKDSIFWLDGASLPTPVSCTPWS
jgi:hypothetical protein